MSRALVILNPVAGKMRSRTALFPVVEALSQKGFLVSVYITKGHCDALSFVIENGENFGRIVCCGGDGTLNETLEGVMNLPKNSRPTVGYIPCGSTNDLARTLKISTNLKKAAQSAASGIPFSLDIGSFNDRFFTYIAAFGAFTRTVYSTPQKSKNALGHLAYVFEGLGELPTIRPNYLKIICDDVPIEGWFYFGAISNTLSIGGIYRLPKKRVDLTDGLFEVVLVRRPDDPIENLSLISNIAAHNFNDKRIIFLHAKNIVVIAPDEPLSWTLDGEYGGERTRVEIKNIHGALHLLR